MNPSREALALHDEWQPRPDVIEQDWALGWLLAGIAAQPSLASWVFKGGTALRKCYYETYRCSEDLDFTVVGVGPRTPDGQLRSYRVDRIAGVSVTRQPFRPRFAIEF